MQRSATIPRPGRALSLARIAAGVAVIVVLGYTFALGRDGFNPFDYFGYFTNLSSLLAAGVFVTTGAYGLRGSAAPRWLALARAVATTCLIIVGVVYNVLVPGTGSAPVWVRIALHIVFPALALVDWLVAPDRPRLSWRELWVVFPYPVLWLAVVLVRGAVDGWVPYGFLLPERGAGSLVAHVVGLLIALTAAGALVWGISRIPRGTDSGARRAG
ncbi:Pr6Pr family membrane protein [Microbacterium sp. JZ37]|uniref:Pr6Pr family membrane protein n=1 Tax=Microbacterium sp. JZ37 TaxID=2654193 RepID=UPI002B482693|nr:Pr6Pr family membrane protein [Microbacterium sp. JZ37]WRH16828.1 hypothetical protein GC092_04360 [Microbacterium sp. JZ37]